MSEWRWEYDGYAPAVERLRESLCTLGNGYFATRGVVPESRAGLVHYPGTYVAGCYNRLELTVAGWRVVNEDLVNLPNWLRLRFRPRSSDGSAGPWFSPDIRQLLDYRHALDLRRVTLTRMFRYMDAEAGPLRVEQVRLVHMGDPHLAALRTVIAAEDWSGGIEIESAVDGDVINGNVHRYRSLNGKHLCDVRTGAAGCRTTTSDIVVAMATRTVVSGQAAVSSRLRPARHRPAGSMLAPNHPAAVVAGNVETSQAVIGCLYAAMGIQAEGSGTMNNVSFGNERHQYYETIGSGAGPGFDGASVVQTHMTNSRLTDPEVLEWRHPVLVEEFAIRHGSGGSGRWHGGDGAVRRIRFNEPMTVSILSSHRRVPPYGMAGGSPGALGAGRVERRDGTVHPLAGCDSVQLRPGDVLVIETPGGGYGVPVRRERRIQRPEGNHVSGRLRPTRMAVGPDRLLINLGTGDRSPRASPRIRDVLRVRGRRRSPGRPLSSKRHMAVCRPDVRGRGSGLGGVPR